MNRNKPFEISALERAAEFLRRRGIVKNSAIELLTPDASTREYLRVPWRDRTAIACVYAEPFVAREQSYLDVTNLFLVGGLPVAKVYDFDGELGVIILEDFGGDILREHLMASSEEERESLLDEAIGLIARIQAATAKAYEMNSIAARLKFDCEKLLWELNFFKTHYFESLLKTPLSVDDDENLSAEFNEISIELEARAEVLCHRDFHAANLMIDGKKDLKIIDHQDARIGSAAYDLASLLLDRVTVPPAREWVREKIMLFLAERERLGLKKLDSKEFEREFDLQTIQRCLKAAGTFSYQSTFRGKTHFAAFIEPMFEIVSSACERLDRFPDLQRIVKTAVENK